MKSIISKSLLAGTMFFLTIGPSSQKNDFSYRNQINFLKAHAKTLLTATPVLTTDQGIANFIRYNYYAINGATNDYEIEQGLGFLEVINNILSGVGSVVGSQGYTDCDSIPTSGTSSGTVSGNGMSLPVQLTYGTGIRKVPAHFPTDANETYDRSITIDISMGDYYVELKCSGANVSTAYVYSKTNMGNGETINEAFYQKDSSTNATYVDFYLKDVSLNIIDVNRFTTDDGSKFSIYHFNYQASSGGNAFAITGNANSKVNFNTATVSNLSTDVAAKDIFSDLSGSATGGGQTISSGCIDMATNSSTTGCPSLDATTDLEIGSTSFDWTFNSMSTFTTSASPF